LSNYCSIFWQKKWNFCKSWKMFKTHLEIHFLFFVGQGWWLWNICGNMFLYWTMCC
jgi:hypothetical protein